MMFLLRFTSVWARCSLASLSWLDWFLPELLLHLLGVDFFQTVLLYVPEELNSTTVNNNSNDKYSVFILIIDSLSRMNYLRSLPQTEELLTTAGALVFKGHHKVPSSCTIDQITAGRTNDVQVGVNSYPNVMALLSGETGGEWSGGMSGWPNKTGMYYIDEERQPLVIADFRLFLIFLSSFR